MLCDDIKHCPRVLLDFFPPAGPPLLKHERSPAHFIMLSNRRLEVSHTRCDRYSTNVPLIIPCVFKLNITWSCVQRLVKILVSTSCRSDVLSVLKFCLVCLTSEKMIFIYTEYIMKCKRSIACIFLVFVMQILGRESSGLYSTVYLQSFIYLPRV